MVILLKRLRIYQAHDPQYGGDGAFAGGQDGPYQQDCVHYLFLTRRFGGAPLDFLPIGLEHLVKGPVRRGAPQGQHLICSLSLSLDT